MNYIVFQIIPVLIEICNYFNFRTLNRGKTSTQLIVRSFPFIRRLLLFTLKHNGRQTKKGRGKKKEEVVLMIVIHLMCES